MGRAGGGGKGRISWQSPRRKQSGLGCRHRPGGTGEAKPSCRAAHAHPLPPETSGSTPPMRTEDTHPTREGTGRRQPGPTPPLEMKPTTLLTLRAA